MHFKKRSRIWYRLSPGATGGGTWLSAGKYKFFINYFENRFPIAPFTLGLVEGVFSPSKYRKANRSYRKKLCIFSGLVLTFCGMTGPLERTNFYDSYPFHLPRQGFPFCLRPLYLLDFREIRAGSWDIFGTVDSCDIALNSRCRLLKKASATAVRQVCFNSS